MYRNIKIILEYDGSRYGGWQKQGNSQNTIQGRLEAILERLAGEPVPVHGSGRTDAGVHALGQTANFHLTEECLRGLYGGKRREIMPEKEGAGEKQAAGAAWRAEAVQAVMEYLNRYLPEDISVLSAEEVPERFHSRLNAVEKTYLYRVETADRKNVFERKYIYGLGEELDVDAMREAAALLVGTHDFRAFCSLKKMKKSTIRSLREISVRREGSRVIMEFTGNGFLYNMVRILAGTLIETGLHRRTVSSAGEALRSLDREQAGFTAPAEGLFLKSVGYQAEPQGRPAGNPQGEKAAKKRIKAREKT